MIWRSHCSFSSSAGLAMPTAPFFVHPVGGDAVLRRLVHLVGTDLDLERLARGTDDRGVQGLVHVELGHGDIVFETPGSGFQMEWMMPSTA
jgi:hypothetical protein